jgi:hypothetical protein
VRAIVASHDRKDSLKRARLGNIQPNDFSVADRAAENASDQSVGMVEIGGIAGASGDLFNAIDQRNAAARELAGCDRIGRHDVASAAALTDSMIFT